MANEKVNKNLSPSTKNQYISTQSKAEGGRGEGENGITHDRAIRLELALAHPLDDLLDLHEHEALDLAIIDVRPWLNPGRKLEVVEVLDLRLDPPRRRAVRVAQERDAPEETLREGFWEGGLLGAFADDGGEGSGAGGDAAGDGVVEVRWPAGGAEGG